MDYNSLLCALILRKVPNPLKKNKVRIYNAKICHNNSITNAYNI